MKQMPIAHSTAQAQPFFSSGSDTGFLFFHGFTSTPQSVRESRPSVAQRQGCDGVLLFARRAWQRTRRLAETGQQRLGRLC